mmetsp:Transcript_78054/g.154682  ORF Transcript_78054/g.154682 Transcript_78054/m.154682 type:complete len:192 (-) Transcript_78054:101-676(-)
MQAFATRTRGAKAVPQSTLSSCAISRAAPAARLPSQPVDAPAEALPPSVVKPARPILPRKVLKLTDEEILSLYHDAQAEAAMEADWRGIACPSTSRASTSGSDRAGKSSVIAGCGASEVDGEQKTNQQCLRMLSRALQQPGLSPREVAARIMDPAGKEGGVCCKVPGEEILSLEPPGSCDAEKDRGTVIAI